MSNLAKAFTIETKDGIEEIRPRWDVKGLFDDVFSTPPIFFDPDYLEHCRKERKMPCRKEQSAFVKQNK